MFPAIAYYEAADLAIIWPCAASTYYLLMCSSEGSVRVALLAALSHHAGRAVAVLIDRRAQRRAK